MSEELLDTSKRFLEAKGFEVRYNHRYTHLQLRICPYCGNDRWNFDIELTDKFVFGCWACTAGGYSAVFFRNLGSTTRIPTPEGTSLRPSRTHETSLFWSYPAEAAEVSGHKIFPSHYVKPILPKKSINYNKMHIQSGVIILGALGKGMLIIDAKTKRPRWSTPDLFIFENQPRINEKTLVVVENFYDIFPFFENYRCLVLGGSTIRHSIIAEAKEKLADVSRIIVALDKHAEKPFLRQLQTLAPHLQRFILRPSKHSPAESETLSLVQYI